MKNLEGQDTGILPNAEVIKQQVIEAHIDSAPLEDNLLDLLVLGRSTLMAEQLAFPNAPRDQFEQTRWREWVNTAHGDEETWAYGSPVVWSGYDVIRSAVKGIERNFGMGPERDVLDLGAGTFRLPLYGGIVTEGTGATFTGVEIVEGRVALAEERIQQLGLGDHVEAIAGNARDVSLREFNTFYLYLPFTPDTSQVVFDRLGERAEEGVITLVCHQGIPGNVEAPWVNTSSETLLYFDETEDVFVQAYQSRE